MYLYYIVPTSTSFIRHSEVTVSAIRVLLMYCTYGDVSRCIYQRSLFGRCLLLEVSVNKIPLY